MFSQETRVWVDAVSEVSMIMITDDQVCYERAKSIQDVT